MQRWQVVCHPLRTILWMKIGFKWGHMLYSDIEIAEGAVSLVERERERERESRSTTRLASGDAKGTVWPWRYPCELCSADPSSPVCPAVEAVRDGYNSLNANLIPVLKPDSRL